MREYEAGIIRIENRGGGIYILELSCPNIAGEALPGQFVQVMVAHGSDPFLRRTFSVCGVDRMRGSLLLMIDVVGPGTGLLASAPHGGCLNIIGPLGKGFSLDGCRNAFCMLIAGGVGIAPLLFLSEALREQGAGDVTLILGARTSSLHRAFDGLVPPRGGFRFMQATDDGSLGFNGFATGLMEEQLRLRRPDRLFTCGPAPMMKTVAAIAVREGIPCQASLEHRMACGIGACFGCAVRLRSGVMARSCVDGPVFDASEVVW
jgi:dihydroorotate dehydrogenase electron transfer subunit